MGLFCFIYPMHTSVFIVRALDFDIHACNFQCSSFVYVPKLLFYIRDNTVRLDKNRVKLAVLP